MLENGGYCYELSEIIYNIPVPVEQKCNAVSENSCRKVIKVGIANMLVPPAIMPNLLRVGSSAFKVQMQDRTILNALS